MKLWAQTINYPLLNDINLMKMPQSIALNAKSDSQNYNSTNRYSLHEIKM